MENQLKALNGAWTVAIGTVMAAVGGTPSKKLSDELHNALNLWGNVLQASGNALLADAEKEISINKIGNEIQSVGNSIVVAGLVIDFKKETKQKLDITGNWFQALGGAAAFGEGLGECNNEAEILNLIGNLLQSIGNSLQAIGGTMKLKEKNEESKEKNKGEKKENENSPSLDVTGGWIQAIGSVLSLLGEIKAANFQESKNEL